MSNLQTPRVPVSWGELIDKITILEIKRVRIADAEAVSNVEREHRYLHDIFQVLTGDQVVQGLKARLLDINQQLWDVEDRIRDCEKVGDFGAGFIALARSVYQLNDRRAAVKREINLHLRSELIEEKSYH